MEVREVKEEREERQREAETEKWKEGGEETKMRQRQRDGGRERES